MGPEKAVQNQCAAILRRHGYTVLRCGYDGWPDVIALHPSGRGKGWLGGKPVKGGIYCRWQGPARHNSMIIEYGVNFFPYLKYTKLFIEYKKPGGGILNPRQKVILQRLHAAGTVAVITSAEELKSILYSLSSESDILSGSEQ